MLKNDSNYYFLNKNKVNTVINISEHVDTVQTLLFLNNAHINQPQKSAT